MKWTILQFLYFALIIELILSQTVEKDLPEFRCTETNLYTSTCHLKNIKLTIDHPNFQLSASDTSKVKRVEIDNSTIPTVTSIICETFPNLEIIKMESLSIERIAENAFYDCPKLSEIYLGDNRLSKLGKLTFSKNLELKTISLYGNELKHFDNELFLNLENLNDLKLSVNELREIPIKVLKNLKRLQKLSLHHNRLLDLDAKELVKELPNLEQIAIRDNDFACDRLEEILKIFAKHQITVVDFSVKSRSRPYQVTATINGIECLSKEQHEREHSLKIFHPKYVKLLEHDMHEIKRELKDSREDIDGFVFAIVILAIIIVIMLTSGLFMFYKLQKLFKGSTSAEMTIIGHEFPTN